MVYPMLRVARLHLAIVGLAFVAQAPASWAAGQDPEAPQSGVRVTIVEQGSGAKPEPGNVVIAHYVGTLDDGTVFDSSRKRGAPIAFTLAKGQVIKGWDEAFARLRVGDKAILVIPPELAYGPKQRGPIPPNSLLHFEVELVDVKPAALADVIEETINARGSTAGLNRFQALKAIGFGPLYLSESQLNGLGYRYLGKNKLEEAVTVLSVVTELFPNSGNAADSLGEAYAKAGRMAMALKSYRRSLELDPTNRNAEAKIAELLAQ